MSNTPIQPHSVTVEEFGMTFETGGIAKQANGAVTVRCGDTLVFASAVAAEGLRSPDQDFFPLTVDYREKFSAAGRFPGGYFKREGRPSEKEILTSRLTDRPLRPLFPKGFLNEVQVIGLVMASDQVNEPDILFVNAASAAVACSDIPWNGPIGCVRVAEINGQFITNPTTTQMFESTLDLIYVGNENDMMMIEGSAEQISEERFIEALEYAHAQIQKIIAAQKKLIALCGKTKRTFDLRNPRPEAMKAVRDLVGARLAQGVFQESKVARSNAVSALKGEAEAELKAKLGEATFQKWELNLIFEILQEELYRGEILDNARRVDGRGPKDLRAISCQAGVLPRVHGSGLFQRGETQGIVTTTLGTSSDVQDLDGLTGGPTSKSFILHYNFPPFSVGETGRTGSPGRREVGHGNLAERSLLAILPTEDIFPYTIRLVSDIFESNGSTSMASVCGGTLALMDAGVPITDMVAGISCGLVTEESGKGITKHVVLTDIIGAEDHFGDMDFKICGTRKGITGFQLDLKIHGLPMGIAKEAIVRNREARNRILDIMSAEISAPRAELKPSAPRIHQMQIDPEKIGMLIGPGGKNIRRICEVSGAQIDINEDNSGRILVFATSAESMQRAIDEVTVTCGDIEIGKTYRGVVRGVKEFGAFVECMPGKEGLVHVSELADCRVNRTEDVCKLGDEMWVKCIGIDEKGRVRLSRRIAMMEIEAKEKGLPIPEFDPNAPLPPKSGEGEGNGEGRGERRHHDRGERGPRGDRGERGPRHDRGERGDRGPRGDRGERGPRHDRGERAPRNPEQAAPEAPATDSGE